MPELLRMPEVAASSTEAVLSRWPVAEGTRFSARDVIATVETEKALVDVEAEADGVLLRTLVAEGTEVAVGAAIAVLGSPGEQVGDLGQLLEQLGVGPGAEAAPDPAPDPAPGPASSDLPEEARVVPDAPAPGASPLVPVTRTAGPASTAVADGPAPNGGRGGRVFASPLGRRLAAEAGLALGTLTGSGPGGRIVRRDVEAAIAEQHPAAPAVPATTGATTAATTAARTAAPAPAAGPVASWTEEPASRMRRAVAARLTQSWATAPHFYVRGSARVDRLLALRAELNDGSAPKVSVNDLVVKAVAQAHLLVPAMNVAWTGDAVRTFSGVDVAVAVATGTGLVTPVVRAVERASLRTVADTTRDLVERAQSGRLQQAELEGGSITVTNLGMYGTEEFAAILNPPQAAILAVGAALELPVVVDGRLEVGTVLRVVLSVDHRPVDGATAARWMAAFTGLLEAPVRILA